MDGSPGLSGCSGILWGGGSCLSVFTLFLVWAYEIKLDPKNDPGKQR